MSFWDFADNHAFLLFLLLFFVALFAAETVSSFARRPRK